MSPIRLSDTSAQASRTPGAIRSIHRFTDAPRLWLIVILTVQAALSLRLVWGNTAFGDEALYLWSGHLEVASLLHGVTSPYELSFPGWFSGSPLIYPPIGALADSFGGLAAARILSLGFMLGATILLYLTTARLLDCRAAVFAAAVFAVLAPTQNLGAFATYDPMALFLLAFATWLAVRAASHRLFAKLALLTTAGMVMALADATKYATLLWSPVVIVVAAVGAWQKSDQATAGLRAGIAVSIAWFAAIGALLAVGGEQYWHGFLQTTLVRTSSDASVSAVLNQSFTLIGSVLILALLGVLASIGADACMRVLCASAMAAVILAPLNQARIHTTTSLHKHVDFGAWFAAIAAGYIMARISRIDVRRGWCAATGLAVIIPALFGSVGAASNLYHYWPNSTRMIAAMRPLVSPGVGPILSDQFDVTYYYLHTQVYPGQVVQPWGFFYWDNAKRTEIGGVAAYELAIEDHYFKLVEVDGYNIPSAEVTGIEHALSITKGWRLVWSQPFVWQQKLLRQEVWQFMTPEG